MARNVKFSFLRGGGSSLEVLYGKVSLTPTNLHTLSSTAVLPAPTTFDLINGTALATNVAPTPAPVDGTIAWAYKVKITDNFGKTWEYLVGVPDGTTEINFNVLPRYSETRPPAFGAGPAGPAGQSATIAIGSTTSGPTPAVTNTGTSTDAVLNFTLAKGDKGDTGAGVPVGGTALQVVRKNAANTTTEWATVDKALVGLGNVDNTSDLSKPVSTAQQTAINALEGRTDLNVETLVNDPLSLTYQALAPKFVRKNELVVNVLDFGAVGDGTTDSTTALRDAMTYLGTQGGGVLWFPVGTYLVSNYVQLVDNVILEFNHSTFIKPPNGSRASYAVFASRSEGNTGYGSGVRNVVARNGTFRGSFDTATKSDVCGFALHHAENCYFENITFQEALANGHAFDLNGCKDIFIDNVKFVGMLPGGGNYNRAEAIQLDMSRSGSLSVLDTAGSHDGLGCENIRATNIQSLALTTGYGTFPAPNVMGSHARREGVIHKNIVLEGVLVNDPMEDTAASEAGVLFHSMGIDGLRIRGVKVVSNTDNNFRLVGLYVKTTGEASTVDPNGVAGPTVTISPLTVKNVDIEYDTVIMPTTAGKTYQYTNYIQGLASSFAENIHLSSKATSLGAATDFTYTRFERVNGGSWYSGEITGGGIGFSPLNCDSLVSASNIYKQVGANAEYINNCRGYRINGLVSDGAKGKAVSVSTGSGFAINGATFSNPSGTSTNSKAVVSINGTVGVNIQGVQASTAVDTGSERGMEIYGAADNFIISGNVLSGYTTKVVNSATGTNSLVDRNI